MRAVLLCGVAACLAAASAAAATPPRLISLPSPLTPLSAAPPVGGGAVGPREGRQHRIHATTRVTVSVDRTGTPFALRAVQRLEVLHVGDYTFSIGAPIIRVVRAPGSQSDPGQRAQAILWAGFSPGTRILAARADLRLTAAAALPLRLTAHDGTMTLRNVTGVTTTGFDAAARPTELLATFAAYRRATASTSPVAGGSALVTSPVRPVKLEISAPLAISGTIGGRPIDLVLGGAAHPAAVTLPGGAVRLVVRPLQAPELLSPPPGESGRALLARAVRASLELARVRQYDTFLGNPDPAGSSRTTYLYVSAQRPVPQPVATARAPAGRDWLRTALWVGGALAAVGVGAVVWARS